METHCQFGRTLPPMLRSILSTSVLVVAILTSSSLFAKAQDGGPLDLTIKSCQEFSLLESHLDAAYHVVTKGYRTFPNQKEPVAQLEGVENPTKMKEFMEWYPNGGASEMSIAGDLCRVEMNQKSGELTALRAAWFIDSERARTAEFYAGRLPKQCAGKSFQ